jgi:hypothetical protein
MMNFSGRNARRKRLKAVRVAVATHRAALKERGLVRLETFVERDIATKIRDRAKAANMTLRAYLAEILTGAIRG